MYAKNQTSLRCEFGVGNWVGEGRAAGGGGEVGEHNDDDGRVSKAVRGTIYAVQNS